MRNKIEDFMFAIIVLENPEEKHLDRKVDYQRKKIFKRFKCVRVNHTTEYAMELAKAEWLQNYFFR